MVILLRSSLPASSSHWLSSLNWASPSLTSSFSSTGKWVMMPTGVMPGSLSMARASSLAPD
ncbi:hypothetical protein D3C79_955710 [compost metagenome]